MGRHYDEAKPLLLISVVGVEGEDEFAVVASMSHVACDGSTFYQIYNMLLHGHDITALDPTRIDLQRKRQEEKMGKDVTNLLSSAGFILAALRGILSTKVLGYFTRRYEVQTKVHLVSNDIIEELKRDKDDDIPFVSTNDILTSWFLTNCACRHGMMAVNLRGRLEGYDDSLAGNYENLIYYRSPEDCASPSLIRKSIKPLKRTVTTATPIDGWTRLARDDFSIITNWATFASDDAKGIFGLKGCKAIGHLPVYDLKNCVPSIAVAVIVRYAPGITAIICSGTEAQLQGLEDSCNFVDTAKKVECHF